METWGIFWAFVVGFAIYDGAKDWSSGDGLRHTFRAFVRLSFIFLLSFHDYGFDAYYTAGAFKLGCYRFLLFWITFDILVNIVHFRKEIFRYRELKHIFHLGTTAFLDWVFRAAWGAVRLPGMSQTITIADVHAMEEAEERYNRNLLGAIITQYVFKALLLIITYQWYATTSDTYLFTPYLF